VTNAFRIVKSAYVSAAFTGLGAKQWGGRFNEIGTAVVYTSGSLSLAAYEIMVHVDRTELAEEYFYFRVNIPKSVKITVVNPATLPAGWDRGSLCPEAQLIGTKWVRDGKTAVLKVPSALVPGEFNLLLNPNHEDIRLIKIVGPTQFKFDVRLI
jgi:RES domain-containing protein